MRRHIVAILAVFLLVLVVGSPTFGAESDCTEGRWWEASSSPFPQYPFYSREVPVLITGPDGVEPDGVAWANLYIDCEGLGRTVIPIARLDPSVLSDLVDAGWLVDEVTGVLVVRSGPHADQVEWDPAGFVVIRK